MRLGIDARIANYSTSGIARYTKGVLSGLSTFFRESQLQSAFSSVSVFSAMRKHYPLPIPAPLKSGCLLTPPHAWFERWTLPIELACRRLDVLHCMDFFAPHPSGVHAIYSVHDVFFLKDQTFLSSSSQRHYNQLLTRLPAARHVVCISQDARNEVIALGLTQPDRVSVVYPGCDPVSGPRDEETLRKLRHKFSLRDSCVLFVGTIEPRKNITRMVEAYARAGERFGWKHMPPFVLVGRFGYRSDEIIRECRRIASGERVRFVGEISEIDLGGLYALASASLFITLGEGFGFPIIESMHAGVPVITSNRSASAEIAGNAAMRTSPEDVGALAESIVELLSSAELRERLRESGRRRATEFRWERAGAELHQLYERVSRS